MVKHYFLLLIFFCGFNTLFAQEKGNASYYSDKLIGNKTASGERYDAKLFTCAHRTHPFGTQLKITNTANKKSVIVTVNDRGPYHKSRVVDLSKAAAKKIDLIRLGIAKVKVEVVEPEASLEKSINEPLPTDSLQVPTIND